jgi:hypothetical protein
MKLYIYSLDRLAFVEVKRTLPVLIAGFVVIAAMSCAGGLALVRQSNGGTTMRPTKALTIENDILRYQIRLMNTQLSILEREAEQHDKLLQNQSLSLQRDARIRLAMSKSSIVVWREPTELGSRAWARSEP